MFKSLEYINAESSMIRATRADDTHVILEPISGDRWNMAIDGEYGTIAPFNPTPAIDLERASMRASPAQIRVALHRSGQLDTVQGIVDGDAEASIIFEYATVIERNSSLIAALGAASFTDEEIDEMFRAAMAVTF